MPRPLALLLPILLASGCASGGEFPSLAPRPVEQLSFEEPIKVDPPVAPDPALLARGNALLAAARAGDRAFEQAYAAAVPAVRSAGAIGTDGWLQAQEAISRVEAARIGTTSALADLDLLLAEEADEPVNDQLWAELRAAREAAEALFREQRRQLDQLKASISGS